MNFTKVANKLHIPRQSVQNIIRKCMENESLEVKDKRTNIHRKK